MMRVYLGGRWRWVDHARRLVSDDRYPTTGAALGFARARYQWSYRETGS